MPETFPGFSAKEAPIRVVRTGDRFHVEGPDGPLSFFAVFEGLKEGRVGEVLTATLQAHPSDAFFWECAPVDPSTRDRLFEFVVVDSPALTKTRADGSPFDEQLAGKGGAVRTFPNLSGDAWLVVPRAEGPEDGYAHLARFVRSVPPAQVQLLWSAVGKAASRWLHTRSQTLWLSTAGLGVSWLHVRLDTKPKYYSYAPFREQPKT